MQSSSEKDRKVIPIISVETPGGAAPEMVSLYEAHQKVYPRSIHGLFSRWRWALVWITQIIFYGLPWIEWGQRQMVLFDLGARRFYIFGWVLYPQDFIYLTGLLVISALALFLFTAVAGRLWCGFACPQTVYSEIFLWVEHKIEGDRSSRLRLDRGGWSKEKITKKFAKQLVWIAIAMWTGYTFVGYFVPIRSLGVELLSLQLTWPLFWVAFYGLATYGNAGYLREQVCKYMCPYARFQSAMFDKDTLIVGYDAQRGEPRGPRQKSLESKKNDLGDCIDCTLCVQVCPVGIDIRNGLQYECIGCGLCADACNSVMEKMHYPPGLIRYSSQSGFLKNWNSRQIIQRVLRPRVLIYSAMLLALCAAMALSLATRTPLKVDVVRDRASLARIVAGGKLENVYRLQIMNATERSQRYSIHAQELEGVEVVSEPVTEIGPAESRWVAVRLQVPYGALPAGSHPVEFVVKSQSDSVSVSEKSVFLVPR